MNLTADDHAGRLARTTGISTITLQLSQLFGLTEFSSLIRATRHSVVIWCNEANRPRKATDGRLRQVYRIVLVLVDHLPEESVRIWFYMPNGELDGRSPTELLARRDLRFYARSLSAAQSLVADPESLRFRAVAAPAKDVISELQPVVSHREIAAAVGIGSKTSIANWKAGRAPRYPSSEVRLRQLYLISLTLLEHETLETTRAWLSCHHPTLGDIPLHLLARRQEAAVLAAAERFVIDR
jgi:hypothetical protein